MKYTGTVSGMPIVSRWPRTEIVRRIEPGATTFAPAVMPVESSRARPSRAGARDCGEMRRTGSPGTASSASSLPRSNVISTPPAATKSPMAFTPVAPSPFAYCAGAARSASPSFASRNDMSGMISTSNCARRLPPLIRLSVAFVNGTPCVSNSQRVQPSSMLAVHGLYSATRGAVRSRVRSPVAVASVAAPHQPPSGVKRFANDAGTVIEAVVRSRRMSTRTPFCSAAKVVGKARESRRSSVRLPPVAGVHDAAPFAVATVCCPPRSMRTVTPI